MSTYALEPTGCSLGITGFSEIPAAIEHQLTPIFVVEDPGLKETLRFFNTRLETDYMPSIFARYVRAFRELNSGERVDNFQQGSTHIRALFKEVGAGSLTLDVLPLLAWSGEANTDDISGSLQAAYAVSTVEQLRDRLGLPLKDVLKAAQVRRSSYFAWKKALSSRPRLSSQGRLWELFEIVDELDETLEVDTKTWLLADNVRRNLLTEGRFDELLDSAISSRVRKTEIPSSSNVYAVGAELLSDFDIKVPTEFTPKVRKIEPAKSMRRPRGDQT